MKSITDNKILLSALIAVFVVNQIAIASISQAMGITHKIQFNITGAKTASAMEIMMPILNTDGLTTHIQKMPTITEVPRETGSADVIADAKSVMLATGTPFYAPPGISFDQPVEALKLWVDFANNELTPELTDRYKRLTSIFPCNFCCGSPTNVTKNSNCGCAHANAARGFFKYMLTQYGDKYTDDQLFGEAYKWQAIWYPSGVVEDYLLATGRGNVRPHKTHGGAGTDGMHGITN